tara:strand:- start:40140 stop:42641 length:2502 start_codon:yes stop_codon:yes gene_type:complete
MADNVQKKLAAIMFIQLVEYDDYLKKDESLALKILNGHKQILEHRIGAFNGRIIKYLDNMTFVEFYSATDAVNCATKIHLNLEKENSVNPSTYQMHVKIGIHMGEVYEKNDDLFGEGVNLAARVQGVAKPGGTVTTQAIYNSIRSEENILVRDMGRVHLKNIKEPERVFKIYKSKDEYDKETESELTGKLIKKNIDLVDRKKTIKKEFSVGITYLKNLGSPDDEFFCYGITQDLIVELTKINKIKVPQIAEIVSLKDESLSILEFGERLNVEFIVTGNIMKMGDNFRITLEFYDINEGDPIWIESWDGTNDILQEIKGKAAYKLLDSLNVDIPEYLEKNVKIERAVSPESYEYFIKGKYLSSTAKSKVDIEIVQDLYKKAISIDSDYIEPRYHYAFELVRLSQLDQAITVLNEAKIVAQKNKDQSGIAGINTMYGIIYKNKGRYEEAIEAYEIALEIRVKEKKLQDEAKVLNGLAQCYNLLNNNDKAFEYYNRSIEIKRRIDDKQGVANSLSNLSISYRRVGDYSKAINYSKEAIQYFDNLDNPASRYRNLMQLGQYQVIVGYLDDGKNNLNESLDFMLTVHDYKSVGMIYRYLGLIEINNENWKDAQKYFIKALNYHQQSQHRAAFEFTTLFLGLSYFYDDDFKQAEKFIDKAVEITSRRTNVPSRKTDVTFYGNTAMAAHLMLKSKLGKCTERELDAFIEKLEKDRQVIFQESGDEGWIKREYWYVSKSYFNLGVIAKFDKYKKMAYEHLILQSKLIEDEKVRNDYVNLPLLHRLLQENNNSAKLEKSAKETSVDNSDDTSISIFLFCPECGFKNDNKFKFCPSCGGSLQP